MAYTEKSVITYRAVVGAEKTTLPAPGHLPQPEPDAYIKRAPRGPKPKPPRKPLTDKQRAFLDFWFANGHNAKEAALSAGFPEKHAAVIGWQLLHKNKKVMEEVQRVEKAKARKTEATVEYVLDSLKDVADSCKAKKLLLTPFGTPVLDADGNPMQAPGVADSAGANRALELLGKHLKMFSESMDINVRTQIMDMSDEELLRVVRESTAQLAETEPAKQIPHEKK